MRKIILTKDLLLGTYKVWIGGEQVAATVEEHTGPTEKLIYVELQEDA